MDDGYGNETTPSSYLSDKSGYIVGTTEVAEGGFADSVTNADGTINSDLMNAGT